MERSCGALGRSWRPRGPVEDQKGRGWFPHRNINRLLERSWGGLGALLGSSWAVLGDLWGALGRLFSLLGALGGVLGALRLQRPFREQFSLNLCCFLGGPNLEKYRFYIGKTMIFRKSLFCSWAVLGTLPEPILRGFWALKSRSWAVLGWSGEVLGGVGWCVVECCVVLCGLGWSLGEVLGGFGRPDRLGTARLWEPKGCPEE